MSILFPDRGEVRVLEGVGGGEQGPIGHLPGAAGVGQAEQVAAFLTYMGAVEGRGGARPDAKARVAERVGLADRRGRSAREPSKVSRRCSSSRR